MSVRTLLGLINYYSTFLPDLHPVRSPLNRLLQKGETWCKSNQCQLGGRRTDFLFGFCAMRIPTSEFSFVSKWHSRITSTFLHPCLVVSGKYIVRQLQYRIIVDLNVERCLICTCIAFRLIEVLVLFAFENFGFATPFWADCRSVVFTILYRLCGSSVSCFDRTGPPLNLEHATRRSSLHRRLLNSPCNTCYLQTVR